MATTPYTVTLTDGTIFANISTGTVNQSSSMTLIGKNYAEYGQMLADNFIRLLENASNTTAPPAPITGQLWWDKTTTLLKVYAGNGTWKNVGGATASSSQPSPSIVGDLWFNTVNQQLYVCSVAGSPGTFIVVGAAVNNSGNITLAVANSVIETVASTGVYVTGVVSSSGNITGSNIVTAGLATVTGNVTGGNVLTGGFVSAVGTVTGSSLLGSVVSASGNVTGGNVLTGGFVSAVGTVTGSSLLGSVVSASGNVTGGNVLTGGFVSAAGTVTGSSLLGSVVSASGNVTGGNVLTGGLISAGGNVTGSFFFGDGSQLTGIGSSSISNGTSNVRVVSSGGNVAIGVGGTSNVAVYATTGEYVTGVISANGNVTGGNVLTGGFVSAAGTVTGSSLLGTVMSVSGNVTGSQFIGSGAGLTSIPGGNVTSKVANASYSDSAGAATTAGSATTAGTVTNGTQANITSVGTLTSLSTTGNVTISSTGQLVAAGINKTNWAFTSASLNNNFYTVAGATRVYVFTGTGGTAVMPAINSNLAVVPEYYFINNCSGTVTVQFSNGTVIGTIPPGATGTITTTSWPLDSASKLTLSIGFNNFISVTGTVTGSSFTGAGTGLTGTAASLTAGSATSATTATTAGTVTNATQSNITGVGTLTSLSVSGTATVGNLYIGTGSTNVAGLTVSSVSPRAQATQITSGIIDPNAGVGQGYGGFRTGAWQLGAYNDSNLYFVDFTDVFSPMVTKFSQENYVPTFQTGKVYATSGFVAGNPGQLNPPTANISGGNINVTTAVSAGGNIEAAGTVRGFLISGGSISAQTTVSATGAITGGSLSVSGNVTISSTGQLVAAGINKTNWAFTPIELNNIFYTVAGATRVYVFTGTGGTAVMPAIAGTSAVVPEYYFINNCSGTVTVQFSNGTVIGTIPTGATGTITATSRPINSASTLTLSVGATNFALGCGGQNWQDVTASRSLNTTYTNSTNRPIMVNVFTYFGVNQSLTLIVNGVNVAQGGWTSFGAGYVLGTVSAVVPPGQTYQASSSAISIALYWSELR